MDRQKSQTCEYKQSFVYYPPSFLNKTLSDSLCLTVSPSAAGGSHPEPGKKWENEIK